MTIIERQHIKWPSIPLLANLVKDMERKASYAGEGESGLPVTTENVTLPTVTFQGTVKVHGTNAAVCYSPTHGVWAQSRNNIITPDDDNVGFAQWVETHKGALYDCLRRLLVMSDESQDMIVTLFGEWAGKGINKGTAIAGTPRTFYVFGVGYTTLDANGKVDTVMGPINDAVYGLLNPFMFESMRWMRDAGTFEVTIDFNTVKDDHQLRDVLINMVDMVEQECPVARHFHGVSGVGEGIVWFGQWEDERFWFKTKGEKHAINAPKERIPVDVERLATIQEFVDYALTPARMEQAKTECGSEPSNFGAVLKWLYDDILKEESDSLQVSGLTSKELSPAIAKKAKPMFFGS